MKRRLSKDAMSREFRFLRTRIEAEVQAPALLFVTSATDRDGACLTAFGLAESLSRSHQRAVLVTTDPAAFPAADSSSEPTPLRRRASDTLEPVRSAQRGDGTFSVVSISPERLTTISRSSVAALMKRLRAENEYVVVDAGDLPTNSFGQLLLPSADAALVTFRCGRSQQPADRTMLETLERCDAKLMGVVMTDEGAIQEFARRDEGETVADLPQRRKAAAGGERLNITLHPAEKSG
jgi:Mrp family chromosome partitioning ATPase